MQIINIEEGIRHHEWIQTLFGTIALGFDAASLFFNGLKNGMNEAGPHFATSQKRDKKIITAVMQVAGKTTDLPITSWIDNMMHLPLSLILIIWHCRVQGCQGAKNIKWKGYSVVYVINEDRVMPVKNSGGGYEIDWHTTEPNYARMITHKAGEKYYTKVNLKGGKGELSIEDGMQSFYLDSYFPNLEHIAERFYYNYSIKMNRVVYLY